MINIKKIYIRSNLHTSVYTPVWNWNNTHKAVHVLTTIMQHPYFFIFHVIPFQFFPFWEERPLVWNILISEIAGPDYSYLGKNRHMNVASMMTQMVKSLPAMQETWVHSLNWEDPQEKRMVQLRPKLQHILVAGKHSYYLTYLYLIFFICKTELLFVVIAWWLYNGIYLLSERPWEIEYLKHWYSIKF